MSRLRAFGRTLWLAFRVWNALVLGVIGAALAIVGAVLVGDWLEAHGRRGRKRGGSVRRHSH